MTAAMEHLNKAMAEMTKASDTVMNEMVGYAATIKSAHDASDTPAIELAAKKIHEMASALSHASAKVVETVKAPASHVAAPHAAGKVDTHPTTSKAKTTQVNE
jgi:hypothetical protein